MIALQQNIDLSFIRHLLFALILLGRLGDVISTCLASPSLVLEANPIARKLGKPFMALTLLVCLVPYLVEPLILSVILVPPSLMVSANNFFKVWEARGLGEKRILANSVEAARNSTFSTAAALMLLSSSFIILTGAVLAWFSYLEQPRSQVTELVEGFGYGIAAFGLAIALHGTHHLRRIFKLAAQQESEEAAARS